MSPLCSNAMAQPHLSVNRHKGGTSAGPDTQRDVEQLHKCSADITPTPFIKNATQESPVVLRANVLVGDGFVLPAWRIWYGWFSKV